MLLLGKISGAILLYSPAIERAICYFEVLVLSRFYCRQLCLDALVEEGDRNFDWRLSFEEFKDLLSESYKPSAKRKLNQANIVKEAGGRSWPFRN